MNLWEVTVEDHRVIVHDSRLMESGTAVVGEIDSHPLATQPACDDLREARFILYDQNTHIDPLIESSVIASCKAAVKRGPRGFRRTDCPTRS
jgi:hypothetical protein